MMPLKRERGERADRGLSNRVHNNVVNAEHEEEDVVNIEEEDRPTQTQTRRQRQRTSSMGKTDGDRRLLRSKYRELKNHLNDSKGKLAEVDGGFMDIVERADKLYIHVSKTREQIEDAELLNILTNEVLVVAKDAQNKSGMSAAEFLGAIIHTYGLPGSTDGDPVQSLDWEALGLEACAIVRLAPGMSTMVGPMDVEFKARKQTGPRRRDQPAQRTRPQAVEEVDADRPNVETCDNMKTMFRILIERNQCPLEHLVLNRVSFAQTTENLFALSFLVKDGNVEMKFSENGSQIVVPRNAPAHADRTTGGVVNSQFVFRMDFKCWKLMQEKVPEGEEVMPNRASGEPSPKIPASRTPIRKNSRNRARETPSSAPPGDSPEDGSGEGSSRRKRRVF